MASPLKTSTPSEVTVAGTETQRLKNQAALEILRTWWADEAQEQCDTWTVLKVALEEDRLSDRPLLR